MQNKFSYIGNFGTSDISYWPSSGSPNFQRPRENSHLNQTNTDLKCTPLRAEFAHAGGAAVGLRGCRLVSFAVRAPPLQTQQRGSCQSREIIPGNGRREEMGEGEVKVEGTDGRAEELRKII